MRKAELAIGQREEKQVTLNTNVCLVFLPP